MRLFIFLSVRGKIPIYMKIFEINYGPNRLEQAYLEARMVVASPIDRNGCKERDRETFR